MLFALHVEAETPEPRLRLSLAGVIGQSRAPYFTSAFPTTSGYGAAFVLSGNVLVAPRFYLGARVPLVSMRVEQPAGALYDEAAWANPELSATLERPWLEHHAWRSRVAATLALGLPLAEHDAAQLSGRALRLANALEGFSEPGLYTPGVFSVIPTGSLVIERPRLKLTASIGMPLLFRLSDADLPPESQARSFGLVPVMTAKADWRLFGWLSLVAAPRLTAEVIAPANDHAAAVHFVAAGGADVHWGEHLTLSARLQAPIAGALGGSTVASGLQLNAKF
jgi:hypothetical protein